MGFNVIIIRSSFTIAFTEIIKVKLVHPRFPPPPVLPRHDLQCPEDQPFSLVTEDRRTTSVPTLHPQSLPTTSIQAQFYEDPQNGRHNQQSRLPKGGRHRELEKAEVKKCQESVQRVLAAVKNFTNPFTVADKNRLYSLASGHATSGAEQRRLPAPRQVSQSTFSSVLGRTHEVLSGACATSLGTREVYFSKLNKAATLHYHLEDITPEDLPYPKDALFIQDRTTLLHNLTNPPPTCGEICLHVLDQMVAKKHFLFSTDSYHPQSSSETIILAGPSTRKPYDCKMFRANDDNKKQLYHLLLLVWNAQQAASRLERTEMAVLIYPLEKTTVRLFLECMYSMEKTASVPSNGRGKVGPLKKLEKHPRFHQAFRQLGEEWNLKYHVLKQLEEFTCLMYGQNRESSMDGLRATLLCKIVVEDEKLISKSKTELVRLPPCHSVLSQLPAVKPPRSLI
ncbi:hypothetical protein NP493_304g07046 [Ridgeia piscesae]|uniref:Uncharacterized protein n=1 Tax=Ridgeia piscesae TaxID=27915 RepID=A0AAD9L6D0_RIDPI|nr:hypothetical protein NP493_304g07046 [Ridgeia piscesae]